jgi:hypothetical protein
MSYDEDDEEEQLIARPLTTSNDLLGAVDGPFVIAKDAVDVGVTCQAVRSDSGHKTIQQRASGG